MNCPNTQMRVAFYGHLCQKRYNVLVTGKAKPKSSRANVLDENIHGIKVLRRGVRLVPSSRVIRTTLRPLTPGIG